jgi:hypothetical protein
MGIQRSEETALVHAAKERGGSWEHLVAQAASRIKRSQGKLLVAMVLIDRARRTARLNGHFLRDHESKRPWQPSA